MTRQLVSLFSLACLAACGGGTSGADDAAAPLGAPAHVASKGGGGAPPPPPPPPPPPGQPASAPGGGTRLPPPPVVDGPAWYFDDLSGVGALTPDIDFDRVQNQTPGGVPVGASRSATEGIYNVSKKTPLQITDIRLAGANPGDFVITPQAVAAVEGTVLPANKGALVTLPITFTPTAPGARSALLVVSSAAGVVQLALTGTGLPDQPVLQGLGPVTFLSGGAPATFQVRNGGGATLVLQSIQLGGAAPQAFTFAVANHGFSNCFAGVPLAPLSSCFVAVGPAPGAVGPATASLDITSNDPVHPVSQAPLSLLAP